MKLFELLRAIHSSENNVRWREQAEPPDWLVDDRTALCAGELEEDDEAHWWYNTKEGDTLDAIATRACANVAGDDLVELNESRLGDAAWATDVDVKHDDAPSRGGDGSRDVAVGAISSTNRRLQDGVSGPFERVTREVKPF